MARSDTSLTPPVATPPTIPIPAQRRPAAAPDPAGPTDRVRAALSPVVHSLARAVAGFLIACHGWDALLGAHAVPAYQWPGGIAGVIELVGGALVVVGLGTRVAAVLLSGALAFAYFTVHQRHGLLPIDNHGEPAALYAWLFLLIAVVGPGRYSLDRVRTGRSLRR